MHAHCLGIICRCIYFRLCCKSCFYPFSSLAILFFRPPGDAMGPWFECAKRWIKWWWCWQQRDMATGKDVTVCCSFSSPPKNWIESVQLLLFLCIFPFICETFCICCAVNWQEQRKKKFFLVLYVCRGHLGDIYDLCWSKDSRFLISGSVDNKAIIWDTQTERSMLVLLAVISAPGVGVLISSTDSHRCTRVVVKHWRCLSVMHALMHV